MRLKKFNDDDEDNDDVTKINMSLKLQQNSECKNMPINYVFALISFAHSLITKKRMKVELWMHVYWIMHRIGVEFRFIALHRLASCDKVRVNSHK